MLFQKEREEMCEVCKFAFDRHLTNAAGGNFSARVAEDRFLISPTLMSQQKFCRLKPEDILVIDSERNILEGNGKLTREINLHMAVYEEVSGAKAILHAHPKETMVFAALGLELPHLTEASVKVGKVITLPFAPATSEKLAATVREYVKGRSEEVNNHPIAMLLRKHGIVVVDNKGIKPGFDMLERLEYEAYVNVQARIIKATENLDLSKMENLDYNLDE